METMQDKSIREKLNSLDTLPEGYSPSLDSKWELLMTGQAAKPVEKAPKNYIWYAVAASLLLLIGLSFIFLQVQVENKEMAVALTQTPVSKPETVAFSAEKPKTEITAAVHKKAIALPKASKENGRSETIKSQKNKKVAAPESVLALTNEEPTQAIAAQETITQPSETQPVLAVAELPKTTRKKKATFVEMDFEATQPAKILPAPTQTAQLNIKIKLLSKEKESASTVVQNGKPLRVQHTF